jgi:hypothetical protein
MLENPQLGDPTIPPPLAVHTCFDKLEIRLNHALIEVMGSHLKYREDTGDGGEDTDFDRWAHGQIYQSEFNMT